MKKVIAFAFLLYLVPSIAFAAWWNPFTWGIFQKGAAKEPAPAAQGISMGLPVASTSASQAPDPSTVIQELNQRIAELEDKLQKAYGKAPGEAAPAKPVAAPVPAVQTSGLSDRQVMARLAPAIVLVETATTSGAGAFIDANGDILTNAHTVWTKDASGTVVDAADSVSVILSSGVRKSGRVVGIDETNDIAVVAVADGSSPSYIRWSSKPAVGAGDKAYVFGFPVDAADPASGYGFAAGTISRADASSVDVDVDTKPIDNGGALVTASGALLGVPRVASCKILEDMTNCLKYDVAATDIRARLPKLLAGMMLYKQKKVETAEEALIAGQLQGMYHTFADGSVVDYAIRSVTGENSFDNFNGRLADDQDGKMTKIYLNKLKLAALSIYQAVDFLKTQSYNLYVFLGTEDPSIQQMNGYQRSILSQLSADNLAKEKEYEDKVALWSKKKNEYDAYIADPSKATHDYLMEEGVFVESAADYLTAEKARIMNAFSGETVALF